MSGQAQQPNRYIDSYLQELEMKRLDEEWARRSQERWEAEQRQAKQAKRHYVDDCGNVIGAESRVCLSDGSVVNFPKGMSPAQIQAAVAKLSSAQPNPLAKYKKVVPARTPAPSSLSPDMFLGILLIFAVVAASTASWWLPVARQVKQWVGARGGALLLVLGAGLFVSGWEESFSPAMAVGAMMLMGGALLSLRGK